MRQSQLPCHFSVLATLTPPTGDPGDFSGACCGLAECGAWSAQWWTECTRHCVNLWPGGAPSASPVVSVVPGASGMVQDQK